MSRTNACLVEFDIHEFVDLARRFQEMPDHLRDLLLAFPPGSEWMKIGDTTGDWYIPEHYNDDGTIDMLRMCWRLDIAAHEPAVLTSELVPLVTH